jgi:hypothetical protein
MTQEQLRMQMLAGIITESQYKKTLEESSFITQLLRKLGWAGENQTPQELANKVKGLSDSTLELWYSNIKNNKGIPNTPLAFQQKLVKTEMDKRGLSTND